MVALRTTSPLAELVRVTGRPRARTLGRHHTTVLDQAEDPEAALFEGRPRTRAACRGHDGPCPWIACKYHLYLDVNPETGSIKFNFPDTGPDELDQLPATCALDVADEGGVTLEEVGALLQLTRERIRQVEARTLLKLKLASPANPRGEPIGGGACVDAMQRLADLAGQGS